ncbi:uncharacterized protein [Henckelia pumila]|uniref:uncharacterized protein n=1 Tax=Henckelia pumila TaxID=405737 RepID=UPI003C6DF8B4
MANQNEDNPNLDQLINQAVQRAFAERGGVNPLHPDQSTHLEEIKRLKEEMEQLRKKQVGYLATTTRNIPFTQEILDANLPNHFKLPHVGEYDGKGDPEEHLARFENAALLHKYSDQINLFAIKQREHENLKAYIRRFSGLALEVPMTTPDLLISAFMKGLYTKDFLKSLINRPPETYEELLARAEKYVNMEEIQVSRAAVKRERPKSPKSNRVPSSNSGMGQPFRPAEPDKYCHFHNEYGHTTEDCRQLEQEIERIIQQHSELKNILTRQEGYHPNRRHQERSRQRARTAPPHKDFNRPKQDQTRDDRAHQRSAPPARGIINMIFGGPTDGDSNRARKTSSKKLINMEIANQIVHTGPTLSFGPEDLKGVSSNHNDALVIRVMVANYDVARIFVDSGSSVNVIFQEVINQMDLTVQDGACCDITDKGMIYAISPY